MHGPTTFLKAISSDKKVRNWRSLLPNIALDEINQLSLSHGLSFVQLAYSGLYFDQARLRRVMKNYAA
jgi:hypothetical protein